MAADTTYQGTGLQRRQDGTTAVPTGGSLDIESGATLKLAGTAVTSTAAELNALDGITASTAELNQYCVTAYMADAGTAGSVFVAAPHAGNIVRMSVVPYVINTTTKTVFTAELGGTPVTSAAWEVGVNGAAGTAVAVAPTAANAVAAGGVIELISDGGTDATMPVMFTITIER